VNPDWTSVWVSLAAALIALGATIVSYAVYRNQADPEVIVYLEPDERRSTIINLVIKNIGSAAARDVTFTSSQEIPSEAFGLVAATADPAGPMTEGAFISGIPFLPPGGTRVFTWGQYGGLLKVLGDGKMTVTARYHAKHIGAPRPIKMETTCPLEIASFAGTDASDKNYDKHIAENVKELTKAVEKVAKAVSSSS